MGRMGDSCILVEVMNRNVHQQLRLSTAGIKEKK